MKNLIIGAADLYEWKDVRVWAESVMHSGFSGDVVLLAYRVSDELVTKCTALGINVILINHDEYGRPIDHHKGGLPTQSHRLRNFHISQYLHDNKGAWGYKFVVVTDTRDVYFQDNPDKFLDNQVGEEIYVPSENIRLADEPWNKSMVNLVFGPHVLEQMKNSLVGNSGTFFGPADYMQDLLLTMFYIAKSVDHTGSDQPVLNYMRHFTMWNIESLEHDAGWSCQCGTMLDPTKRHLVDKAAGNVPIVDNNKVLTSNGVPFVIVHQYDRVPQLKSYIEGITYDNK